MWNEFSEIVCSHLGCKSIQKSDRLKEDLAAESLDLFNIALSIEKRLSIQIDESDMASFQTIEQLWSHVQEKCPPEP